MTVFPVHPSIFIVDDTPDNLRLLSQLLLDKGYAVRTALSGAMAIRSAAAMPPDLILLDVNMPQMNGYQVCKHLKQQDRTKDIPIIFISALDEVNNKVQAFQAGGVDYITKPFQAEEVLARIETHLTLRFLQQTLQEQNEKFQQEIQERRLLENKLLTSEGKMRAIFNAMTDIVIILTLEESKIAGVEVIPTHATHNLEQTLLIDETIMQFLREDEYSQLWTEQLTRVCETQESITLDYELTCEDKIYWFSATISPMPDHGVIWVARDITDRQQAEVALRASEIQYRDLVQTANCIILRWDKNGYIRFLNEYGQNFFGYTEQEILGRPVVGSIVPSQGSSGEDLAALITDICQNPESYKSHENESICKNGERVWLSWTHKPLVNSQGEYFQILSVGTDLTARKKTEEALRLEQEKSERLLLNILPQKIATRLKQFEGSLAEQFAEVTILFADIVGFTPFSAQTPPIELVSVLNQIFSRFDHLAERYHLEKIKTIGDAYMVVGGLPTPCQDHTEAMAEMALDMQQEIAKFKRKDGKPFQLRIGINTGSVVAGVIGIRKFSYDLWGDAVNVASRMESLGEPGKIQVTAVTYERLKDQFILEERGSIVVKGKGNMKTYWLLGRGAMVS
ncbi:adenylate/guanylate cyclase domain-containing protein [Spirulina subsalsa]|uniref:adenylate/guanylate cyclase domain-containing protein n=1 Tax=Spirulina subsalsa TaxID=54311 RepID=UPI0002F3E415|nr:adenylate/guanylate cyclase domain-containing protein [Spirulina subsalsa]